MLQREILLPFIGYFALPQAIENTIVVLLLLLCTYGYVLLLVKGVRKWYKLLKISS